MIYELSNEGDMPISVTALRDHCRIIGNDFDTQLTRAYYAAARDIEHRSGLLFREADVSVYLKGSEVDGAVLPVGPVFPWSVAIYEDAGFLLDQDGNYILDENYGRVIVTPAEILRKASWELDRGQDDATIKVLDASDFEADENYIINYHAGMTSIPNDLMVAILELTAHHFENREASAPVQLHAVPSSVWSIVANYGRGKV